MLMNEATAVTIAIFAAMLQVDATLVAFGALFVIYKLQLLQNQYERLLQTAQKQLSSAEVLVLGWHQELRTPELINEMFKGQKTPPVVQLVLANDRESDRIRKLAAVPFWTLLVHIVLTAIQLWLAPPMLHVLEEVGRELYTGFSVIVFLVGVITTMIAVWQMSVKHEDLTLHDWKEAELKNRSEDDG